MIRKMYTPTKRQEEKWSKVSSAQMPSDEDFKTRGEKEHKPWGILKRDYILGQMTQTRAYQMGLWQGRVDKARGLEYSKERNENTYNLGYYRGYTEYESNRQGWDAATRAKFDTEYMEA